MKKLIDKIAYGCFPNLIYKFARHYFPTEQQNINLNLVDSNQKRILVSYRSLRTVDFRQVYHSAYLQINQILKYFIDRDYCIDLCDCNDIRAYERLKYNRYDIIIGFGDVFKTFCRFHHDIPVRILYITENNPEVVAIKYEERMEYFSKRHPNVSSHKSIVRNGYFDMEQFNLANWAILMNSDYNAESMKGYFENLYQINSNAIFNMNYSFNSSQLYAKIETTRLNFVWFGSTGFIHKGGDVLLDAFRGMTEYTLNLYGIDNEELGLFKKLKAENTINKGRVNVLSQQYIDDVVMNNCFVILPSCSEGMSTGVATCMAHGLIPIVTKESGFDSQPFIFELKGYYVEDIREMVREVSAMSIDDILSLREKCYQYAQEFFSLKHFNEKFSEIMDDLLIRVR